MRRCRTSQRSRTTRATTGRPQNSSTLIITEQDQITSIETTNGLLYNAAIVDIYIGNVEHAIERLLRVLELTRDYKLRPFEGTRSLRLGNAYLMRGDTAQATTFHAEALKLRRTLEDSDRLIESLRANGSLARAAGDIPGALRLHREALALSTLPDVQSGVVAGARARLHRCIRSSACHHDLPGSAGGASRRTGDSTGWPRSSSRWPKRC